MNSMNRNGIPRSRKYAHNSSNSPSFTPRCTTVLIFTANPLAAAASIPRNTRSTLKPSPFIRPAVASFNASTDTFTRSNPAVRNAAACFSNSHPFVVSATSGKPTSSFNARTSSGTSVRNNGSPPVNRTFSTPSRRNAPTIRTISRNDINCGSLKNACAGPNTSFGMQYGHRKLQRSVTEMRKSRSGRLN